MGAEQSAAAAGHPPSAAAEAAVAAMVTTLPPSAGKETATAKVGSRWTHMDGLCAFLDTYF